MTAVIRPRRPWEAIDLGFSMVRAWWRPVAASWFLSTFPLWLALSVALYRWPAWAMVAFWWLKPVWDRVPLFVLSRALFGAAPSRKETMRALPRLWRGHLVSALTLYRLDPARSFNLPVWQLEGLRGAERWNRARILQQDTRGTAVWLTLACILLEVATTLALYGLFSLLLPYTDLAEVMQLDEPLKTGWAGFALSLLQAGTSYLAVSLIEPFYVAAGFSLYLSRRTHLEGWDVELAFRRLARRLHESEPTSPGTETSPAPRRAALVLAFLLLGAGWPAPAVLAQEAGPDVAQEEGAAEGTGLAEEEDYGETVVEVPVLPPREAVREVLAQPEFQTRKKVTRWKLKYELPDFDWFDGGGPKRARPGLSLPFLRVLAYGVAFLGSAALLIILARWGFRHFGPVHLGRERPPVPETLFGLDIRPESLPDDLPAAAWALWEQGEAAQALGLLYRGALARLVQREGAPVRASWTEGDCLRFVEMAAGAEPSSQGRADYFTRLTRAWQSTAYAHRPPDRAAAESLVRHWNQHFGAAA